MQNQILADSSLFLWSMVLGFVFGLIYEIFRFLRLALPHTTLMTAVEDLLFFFPVTMTFLLFTFAVSDGVVRYFSVCSVVLGFLIYLTTLGKILLFFSDAILRLIKALLFALFRHLLLPPYRLANRLAKFLFTQCKILGIIVYGKIALRRRNRKKKKLLALARRGFE